MASHKTKSYAIGKPNADYTIGFTDRGRVVFQEGHRYIIAEIPVNAKFIEYEVIEIYDGQETFTQAMRAIYYIMLSHVFTNNFAGLPDQCKLDIGADIDNPTVAIHHWNLKRINAFFGKNFKSIKKDRVDDVQMGYILKNTLEYFQVDRKFDLTEFHNQYDEARIKLGKQPTY